VSPEPSRRRARLVIAALAVLAAALAIALVVVLISDGGEDSDDADVTATPTAPPTVTAPEPPTTTAPPPPTEATITQVQAKEAAAQAASEEAGRGGIGIPASDWDVRCTAAGGGPRAVRWTCQVASSSGQCSGTIVAYARAPDVAATTDPRVGCGE
jgi:hypothetical protein